MITSFSQLSKHVEDPEEYASLYYAFFVHRCAIKLTLTFGKVELTPFVNTKYDNRVAWGDAHGDAVIRYARGSIEQHYTQKEQVLGYNDSKEPGFLPTVQNWWLNGFTVCNVIPHNIWSDRGLKELKEMFQVASGYLKDVKGHFVINKRDSPIMRQNLREHPFPALGKTDAHPMHVRPMKKPLSFYVGEGWCDVAIPPPEAWKWATREDESGGGHLLQRCFRNRGVLSRYDFFTKQDKAVFRGTATGAGIGLQNQRILLSNLKCDTLNVGLTAWNKRDRIINGIVDFQEPTGKLVEQLTPKEQSSFKILICVDGHQASSRIIWHLCSGSAIILVDSGPHTLASKLWIHQFLVQDVHYVRAKADLSDINEIVSGLLNDGERAFCLAKNAYKLASECLTPKALAESTAKAIQNIK